MESYSSNKSDEKLDESLLSDIIEKNAKICPESIVCISKHQKLIKSYGDLNRDESFMIQNLTFRF